LSKRPAQGDLAGAAIHRDVGEQQGAFALDIGAIDAQRQGLISCTGNLAIGDGGAQTQGIGGWLGEVGVDRVELLNAGEQGGFTLADQCTFGHLGAANAPGNGRAHFGVTQVQACGFHAGLGRALVGLGALQGSLGHIEVLLADRIDLHQWLVALDRGLRLEQLRLGAGQFALGTGQGGLERCRVDLEQQVAGLDVGAFLEGAFEHDAGDPSAYFGDPYRLDTAWQLGDHGERLGLDGQHVDLARWRLTPSLLAFIAAGQADCRQ
jgi:hypothetical protein